MKQFMRALLCLCLLLPLGAKAEIFVFGDSLSDTGNLAAFGDVSRGFPIGTIGLCPIEPPLVACEKIFSGTTRVSNGPVAVEVLGELQPSLHFLPLIGLGFLRGLPPFGTNYAVAGARAGGSSLGDLNVQIAGFLADFPSAPSDALYVIFIGGNDVRDARNALGGGTPSPETIIADAVLAIDVNIRQLILAGARTFLVVNSPNIASLPETRIIAKALGPLLGPIFVLRTIQLTKQFNQQLAKRLHQIRADQMDSLVKIKGFNLFLFFEAVRFGGKLFGVFENIKDACFNSALYQASGSLDGVFVRPLGHPDCDPGMLSKPPKFDDFVFFDVIHPTGQVHEIVGKALFKLVDDKRSLLSSR